jgi:membrane protease YdiL (CAAX protease family)
MRAVGLGRVTTFYLALVAVGLAGLWAEGGLALLLPASLRHLALAVALGLGVGLALVALSRWMVTRFAWARLLAAELRNIVGELRPGEALLVAALSGLGEEILFRGVLQSVLGLWLTSAVFGLLHIGPSRHLWPWALMAGAAGLIFGLMAGITGDLIAPILAHATINFLNLRFLALTDRRPFVRLGPVSDEEALG